MVFRGTSTDSKASLAAEQAERKRPALRSRDVTRMVKERDSDIEEYLQGEALTKEE
jgi:hypothetical protein